MFETFMFTLLFPVIMISIIAYLSTLTRWLWRRGVKLMKHTILLVEDELGIWETVKIFLKSQNYEVIEAENGKEGLIALQNNDIHLAIVDIMMPVMDGLTMTMKLREVSDIPVIFLTAKTEDIDKITGLNLGADD